MAEQSIAERLREHATDWNGQPLADGEPAKSDPTAGLLRAAADELDRLTKERDRIARNRDMWKGQCERQAETLHALHSAAPTASAAVGGGEEGEAGSCQ